MTYTRAALFVVFVVFMVFMRYARRALSPRNQLRLCAAPPFLSFMGFVIVSSFLDIAKCKAWATKCQVSLTRVGVAMVALCYTMTAHGV